MRLAVIGAGHLHPIPEDSTQVHAMTQTNNVNWPLLAIHIVSPAL